MAELNVIDDYNREGLGIEVDFSLPAERVIRSLEQIIEWRGRPKALRCDNGPEYVSVALATWAEQQGIRIEYIQPGKPQQNAYIERYNRTVRYDWLGSTFSMRSTRSRTSPRAGSGPTITNGRTWPWEASPQNRSWPWRPNLHFWRQLKMGGLPSDSLLLPKRYRLP